MPENRPPIPAELERDVKMEAGYMCAIPACQRTPVEIAHIVPWAKVKEHRFDNLIALCPTCHTRYDNGEIDRKAMRGYKALLQERNRVGFQTADPPADPVALARERLREWETESLERFHTLVRTELSPKESPNRYVNGCWSASYCLVGDIPNLSMQQWQSALQQAQDHSLARSLWPVLGDRLSRPHTYDDTLEAWLGQEPGTPASEAEYWRVSPEAYLYQTAGYVEDGVSARLYL